MQCTYSLYSLWTSPVLSVMVTVDSDLSPIMRLNCGRLFGSISDRVNISNGSAQESGIVLI